MIRKFILESIEGYREMYIAAQDLLHDANIKGKKINGDGSITVYHGTSIENKNKILSTGKFNAGTYFSLFKNGTQYGDSPSDVAKRKYGKNGVVMEIKIDARSLELAAAGSELYSPYELVQDDFGIYRKDGLLL